jgi:hypothetical protein
MCRSIVTKLYQPSASKASPKLLPFASDADRSDIGETYGLLNLGGPHDRLPLKVRLPFVSHAVQD